MVYGKDEDQLPITGTLIDIDKPCINSNLPRKRNNLLSLDIELQKYATCEQWLDMEEPMVDESYIDAHYSLPAYDAMSNGIFEKLEHLSKYHD